jgi:hypothetical protein
MRNWKVILLITIVFAGCKKTYNPPAIASPGSYLVVEGVINSGSDSTIIKLSRTVKLSSKITINPVLHAAVAVESDQNTIFPLAETTNGNYISAGLNLDSTRKYRLNIKIANKQYLSDFVAVLNSPPIDSVSFTAQNNVLNIYSNTHDPKNSTQYYRWDYQETWMFRSNYFSGYKSNGDTVLLRDQVNDEIYTCWKSDTASTITIASTVHLVKDVVVNNPITSVASTSEKLGIKYSILVRQYALSGDAYTFWENLKKNTEQLGGIFDAQPSTINGNIHSVSNPSEPVIGYISAGSTSNVRIFITKLQLPVSWYPEPAFNCAIDSFYYVYYPQDAKTPINQVDLYLNYNKNGIVNAEIPVSALGDPPVGYSAALPDCVDCTLRGTNKQPSFWK